ncbi:hypothetical protein SynRS9902_00760 [Synechococcus sp. RS9902]|nr:hypothetical protein SynRS9902_00760 [Synechococcus sp. RS9902]
MSDISAISSTCVVVTLSFALIAVISSNQNFIASKTGVRLFTHQNLFQQ